MVPHASQRTLAARTREDRASAHEIVADAAELTGDGERLHRLSGLIGLDETAHELVESRDGVLHPPHCAPVATRQAPWITDLRSARDRAIP